MFDYHIHPNYSIDAEGEIDEFCKAAINAGLKEIAFTTHLDTDRIADDCYVNVKGKRVDVSSNIWFEDYESTIRTAGDHFADLGLQVLLGVEVDCFPDVESNLPEGFFSTDFDVILGSVHLIDHIAISAGDRAQKALQKYSLKDLGEKYFSIMLDSIELEIFDVLAHIDLYRRFGESFYGEGIHDLWKPYLKELASKIRKRGIGFEINTSSLRRGMEQPMPEDRIIRALKMEGIEIVIVGSDAHTPIDVGKGIDEALNIIRQIGFPGVSVFRKRKASVIPWPSDWDRQN
ncbi:MAG: histidinol-phosphatase HisJ family protein [Candidatus Thorarchaeota archaeon]